MPMLEEAIVNLLLRHNCVIVPAFGGFVAQSSGAVIDMNSGIITPPRKSVLFNNKLINNDGLLISHISAEHQMDYTASENFLKTKVEEWHNQLKDGKRVSIDKIGHLFLDAERNISFEQDRFFNLLLQSYGLNKVHFISEEEAKIVDAAVIAPVVEEAPIVPLVPIVETTEKATEPTKVVALAPTENKGKAWKYIAAAVLLPIAFYTYWIPVETTVLDSGMISFKDFDPTYRSSEGVYQQNGFSFSETVYEKQVALKDQLAKLPEGEEVAYFNLDGKMIPIKAEVKEPEQVTFDVPVEKEVVVSEEKQARPTEKVVKTTPVASKQMHYITGCFSDKANAEGMVKTLQSRGLNGLVLDKKNGMYRVSAGGANSQTKFDRISKKAQAIGYKGWKLD